MKTDSQITRRRRESLLEHVNAWAAAHPKKRTGVTMDVVETFYDLGMDGLMADDMPWKTDGEVTEQVRVNTQKLFRWLEGVCDGRAALFCLEQVIVAAMPVDRRMSYLNDIYDCASMVVAEKPVCATRAKVEQLLARCIKEDAEADQAMIHALTDHSPEALRIALREQEEAWAARGAGINALRDLLVEATKPAVH